MKKIVSFALCLVLFFGTLSLFSCATAKETIGIIQFGSHESLNNCYEGIIEGLSKKVDLSLYNVEYVNSNFAAEASLAQAKKLVNGNAKVIIAIATPSAISAATAATGKDIPVVYCAVTDASQVANFKNMTGTSDVPDFNAQLELVTAFFNRDDLKIGVLMSTEESSDPAQLFALKEAAKAYSGMEIVEEVVADITTIDVKVNSLVDKKVDCIVNILDNTVVGKLQSILSIANNAGIPVFGSEIEQVKKGCLASASIDYITVGRLAGEQAGELLLGKNVGEVAPKTMENETFPCYNSEVLERFPSLVLPEVEGLRDVKEAN